MPDPIRDDVNNLIARANRDQLALISGMLLDLINTDCKVFVLTYWANQPRDVLFRETSEMSVRVPIVQVSDEILRRISELRVLSNDELEKSAIEGIPEGELLNKEGV